MYSPQLFREKRRAPEATATALSKQQTWLDISMQCRWSVTMETDMYHSGCLTHPLAETERFHAQQSRIKVETTPEVHAGSAEQRRRGNHDGRVDGRADRRWQTEWKEQKCRRMERRGRKVGIKEEKWGHFSVSWWASDRCSVRAECDRSRSLIYSEILASVSGRWCLVPANLISTARKPCESWPLSLI